MTTIDPAFCIEAVSRFVTIIYSISDAAHAAPEHHEFAFTRDSISLSCPPNVKSSDVLVDFVEYEQTKGGVNNIVQYVRFKGAAGDVLRSFVLRIYNNGHNYSRVIFEHAVLACLRDLHVPLSFLIPSTVTVASSLDGGAAAGIPHMKLSNGFDACLCHLILGSLPGSGFVREIGRAAGELSLAFTKISAPKESPTPPYYELYKVHHAVTSDNFREVIQSSQFDHVREPTSFIFDEIVNLEKTIANLLALNLPMQLIHGDLHYDNVLVHEEKVSGVLDFEFCAYDWRAMEVAICLSKYVGDVNATQKVDEFLSGFCEFITLTEDEARALPALIKLRVLSNVVYFVGRSIAKEDGIECCTTRIANYAGRIMWLSDNSEMLISSVLAHSRR